MYLVTWADLFQLFNQSFSSTSVRYDLEFMDKSQASVSTRPEAVPKTSVDHWVLQHWDVQCVNCSSKFPMAVKEPINRRIRKLLSCSRLQCKVTAERCTTVSPVACAEGVVREMQYRDVATLCNWDLEVPLSASQVFCLFGVSFDYQLVQSRVQMLQD